MTNTYITPFDIKRAATGLEINSLIGMLTRFSTSVSVGATTLTATDVLSRDVSVDDQITIFDGSSTEVVTATANTSPGDTTISVTPTVYAHSAKVAICTDGTKGSLSDLIVEASDELENICQQSLLLGTRNDILSLQTMRAAIDNHGVMALRPLNFPVQSVTGLVLSAPGATITLDATQAFLDTNGQLVKFYQLIPTGSTPFGSPFQTMLNQRTVGTIKLTYTSGFAYASMPGSIRKACVLLTSDFLAKRKNPTGATEVLLGKTRTKWGHMGDTSGESDIYKEAKRLLASYVQRVY